MLETVNFDLRKQLADTCPCLPHSVVLRGLEVSQVGVGQRRPWGLFLETGSASARKVEITGCYQSGRGRGCQGPISVRDSLRDSVVSPRWQMPRDSGDSLGKRHSTP